MQYRERQPNPPLNRFVECFWTLEQDTFASEVPPERILPDGCVELILNFGSEFSQHTGGQRKLQPRNFLVGQMTGPILISPTGPVQLLGIRFHPGGTLPFFRVPMHEVTDRIVELGALSTTLQNDLLLATRHLSTLADLVSAVEKLFTSYLAQFKHDSWTMSLAAKIVEQHGLVSVDQLATDAGISSRQMERRFLREIGVGPKLLARILRFQQVFRAVERADGSWASVALDCGYYDQAHLIRDFNQFAHQTPSVLFAEKTALTESFTRKTRKSDFSNTRSPINR
jgi:AraC-like DNA-binding protein